MKKLMAAALALTMIVAAGSVMAQDRYDAGVFADAAGTISHASATPSIPFFIYGVAFDLDGQVKAFELTIEPPVGFFNLGSTFNGTLNVGDGPGEFIVGTGGCLAGEGAFQMCSLNLLALSAVADLPVCLGGTTPSTFAGLPGYVRCDNSIQAFGVAQSGGGVYPDGCLVVNPSDTTYPVATEVTSFGEVKARF